MTNQFKRTFTYIFETIQDKGIPGKDNEHQKKG